MEYRYIVPALTVWSTHIAFADFFRLGPEICHLIFGPSHKLSSRNQGERFVSVLRPTTVMFVRDDTQPHELETPPTLKSSL